MRDRMSAFGIVVFSGIAVAGTAFAEIGAVSAVNRDMNGTPPSQVSRSLELGNQVFRDERIQTSSIGSGQIIFRDQTSISIAPHSDMVLDSYIFDPESSTGEVTISLAKGALRFIGGRITKSRDAIIRTPTATIGIRGGMSIIQVAESGATSVIQIAGERTTVKGLGGKTVTLSRSNAKAEVTPSGDAEFAGLADSEELAPVIKSFEGGGTGGSDAGSDDAQIESGTKTVAESNSEESGGASRQPVSTSGEKQVETTEEEKNTNPSDASIFDTVNTQEVIAAGNLTTSIIVPSSGVFLSTLSGQQAFISVTEGSLIGTTASGDVLRLPVPVSVADFDTTLFGEPKLNFKAEALYPKTGFTEVRFGEGFSLTGFVNPGAFGFSDLGIGFHVFQFGEGPGGAGHEGLVLFGTPTPGQAAFLPSDSGSLPSTFNTASAYVIEPEFELGGEGGGEHLFVIGNGGEPRFAPAGASVPANGGKVLGGSVRVETDLASGDQISDFSVFAQTIGFAGGGPRIDGEILETNVGGPFRQVRTSNVRLLADQNGRTVFGPDGRYMFAASPMISDPGSTGFFLDAGEQHEIGQPSTDPEPIMNLLTLHPGLEQIVSNPLSLAQHTGSRALGTSGFNNAQFDALHAAGIAACSDGDCGQEISPGTPVGFYAARTGTFLSNGGTFAFENGLSGTDTNEVLVSMGLEAVATEVNTGAGGNTFNIPFGGAVNANSAYLDDAHFGLASAVNINAGGEATSADVLLASSGAVGDGGIFVGQNPNNFNTQPLNARWGWWSASFDVVSGGSGNVREDLFHMGAWVAGVRPDPIDIPASGVVAFKGVAIGTDANLTDSITRVVGGDFELDYDFGLAQGNFRMNIAGLSINETAFGDPGNSHAYQINASTPVQIQADGTFFSSATNPVAATGGDFQIDDFAANRQIVGVFVGDASSP